MLFRNSVIDSRDECDPFHAINSHGVMENVLIFDYDKDELYESSGDNSNRRN